MILAGPTASGKSEVALILAERLRAEIISFDSMQVYRGMDIGTAKPNLADQRRVRHHLIDILEVTDPFDAAHFVQLANEAVEQIGRRGMLPLFCGGTGLYLKAWLEGLGDSPPPTPGLRAELEQTPVDTLLLELEQFDPETHARIDRRNPRRIIRAVEVLRLSGRPLSEQRSAWSSYVERGQSGSARPVALFGLRRAAPDLRQRIEDRVDAMFRKGLVEETRALLERGLDRNRTAMQAIGYRQVVEYLRGLGTLEEAVPRVKQRTRQYARRQSTWFRRQVDVRWVEVERDEPADAVSERILAQYRAMGLERTLSAAKT